MCGYTYIPFFFISRISINIYINVYKIQINVNTRFWVILVLALSVMFLWYDG